jgi:hypothetical protein
MKTRYIVLDCGRYVKFGWHTGPGSGAARYGWALYGPCGIIEFLGKTKKGLTKKGLKFIIPPETGGRSLK